MRNLTVIFLGWLRICVAFGVLRDFRPLETHASSRCTEALSRLLAWLTQTGLGTRGET